MIQETFIFTENIKISPSEAKYLIPNFICLIVSFSIFLKKVFKDKMHDRHNLCVVYIFIVNLITFIRFNLPVNAMKMSTKIFCKDNV